MGPQSTQIPPAGAVPEKPIRTFGAEPQDTPLADAIATIRKRLWLIVLAFLLGISYGYYKSLQQPVIYSTYGMIEVRTGAANAYRLSAEYGTDTGTKMNTELIILRSDTLMDTVAREMDLVNNPDFYGIKGPMPHRSMEDPAVRLEIIGQLQGGLAVSLVPRTDMIRLTYTGANAKLCADIINRVVSDYIARSYETRFASTQRVSQWLSGQLDDLKQQVETSQEQLMELQKQLNILGDGTPGTTGASGTAGGGNELTSIIQQLMSADTAAKLKRINAEADYNLAKNLDATTFGGVAEMTPGTSPNGFSAARSQLIAAKTQYAEMMTDQGPNNTDAVKLKAQIDALTEQLQSEENRVLVQSKENYVAAVASEEKISAELEARKADMYKQRDAMVEYTVRLREFEQNRTLYDGLEQRLRTAGVQAGLESLEVDVVDQALPPPYPLGKATSSIIMTNTVIFIVGGIVLAFLLESMDTGLHNITEIERVMELPSLAIIPRSKRPSTEQTAAMSTAFRNIMVLTQPKSQFSEAFRSLRTSLMLSTTGHPPKFILFTSATPSEGKTTTATNLAAVLAQRDARVLLIDADLRRPNVHHRFGLAGKVGLTTLLAGTTTLEESLQRIPEIPNLDILSSGPVPPFPTEMLSSEAMHALLERLGHIYSHVVIDSPPILSVTDGIILARLVDSVVLVIRHGKSSKQVIRRAHDLLARSGAPMAGLVLNAVDLNSPDYYGYYGYSGYSYSSVDADSWVSQPAGTTIPGGKSKR